MIRMPYILAGLTILLAAPASAQAPALSQTPTTTGAAATPSDEPVPRAARAKARQDCLADNVALGGEDLRPAMRDCLQAKFPDVQLYARDGVTRDGKPTASATRAACKAEVDARTLEGATRTAALTACFNERRPDLAQRVECRKEARAKGLDGVELRNAVEACAREASTASRPALAGVRP